MNGAGQAAGALQGGMSRGGNFPAGGPPGGFAGGRGAMGFLPGGPITSIVIMLLFGITLVVLAIAFYKLFKKTGYSGALGLLMLVPVVNLGVALWFAFAEWPISAELERLKMVAAFAPGAQAPAEPQPAPAAEQPDPLGA